MKQGLLSLLMLVLMAGGGSGLAGAWFYVQHIQKPKNAEWPVAVVDINRLTGGSSAPEDIAKAIAQAKRIADQLTENGFIVFNPAAIMTAPEEYWVPALSHSGE